MYKDCRISVAMATYNGERFIEEQLNSIIDQTVMVDEIVISDDGSTDRTISIINSICSNNNGICFKILTDNLKHGAMGNFEHALKNCTGDYIFLADQDDVWNKEKVERVTEVFIKNPNAHLVFHDADLIDKNGVIINGIFNRRINGKVLGLEENGYMKLAKNDYLEKSVSWSITNGMVMCISNWLKNKAIPFPNTSYFHDSWISFLAIKYDSCYFLNEPLAMYRLHGANTGGNKAYTGSAFDKIRKGIDRLKKLRMNSIQTREMYYLSLAMKDVLDKEDKTEKQAYDTACIINDIGKVLMDIESSNRLVGGIKLASLYRHNMRYRNSGTKAYLLEMAYVLFVSKKKRKENLGMAEV